MAEAIPASLPVEPPPAPQDPIDGGIKALGHQGAKSTGGNCNMRVLRCANIDICFDYNDLFNTMKNFGQIKRIKMVFKKTSVSYDAYITFVDNNCAESALDGTNGKKIGNCVCTSQLYDYRNVQNDDFDFIPQAETAA